MSEKGMDTDSLKLNIEAHLTSLHGTINNLDIDEFGTEDGAYSVKGSFQIPWQKKYSFEMKLDVKGGMASYKRQEINEHGYA